MGFHLVGFALNRHAAIVHMLSSQQPSPHLPPIFEPAVIVMEPMTLPCAEQVMQLSVQTEAARSIATEQPDAVSPASSTATGKRPAAGWGEAEISEAARARPNPSRWRRRLAKPDGRCAVRSTLFGADHPLPDGVTDILAESSVTACAFIREMRTQAAEALKAAMDEDETLQASHELLRQTLALTLALTLTLTLTLTLALTLALALTLSLTRYAADGRRRRLPRRAVR